MILDDGMSRLFIPPTVVSSGFTTLVNVAESDDSSKLEVRVCRDKPEGRRGAGVGVFGGWEKGVVGGAFSSFGAGGGW